MSLLREAQRCLANQAARKSLNAFITLPDTAAVLRQVELTESQASQRSPLAGRLIAFKDNICTTDAPTTCASALLRSFTSPYDATVVQRLRASGALVAGKTNLDEFGMGSHCLNSHFGPVSQQSRPDGGDAGESVSAGGSSGGSAVAVATEQCWAALGTDTGGSVRLPAAYTGIVGFKPSYGLVSRWGVVAYANSLDTVGVLARDTQTARQVFHAINHHDPNDPTSLPPSTRSRLPITTTKARSPLRIGIPTDYNIAELTPPVRRAWLVTLARLSALGHALVPVALPTTHQALSAYYVLAPAEASSNLAKYDGVRYGSRAAGPDGGDAVLFSRTRGEGFGDEVKRRIVLGAYTLSAEAMDSYFIQAQRVRRLVQRDFDCAFSARNPLLDEGDAGVVKEQENEGDRGGVDVLVCPTAPSLPPRVEGLRDAEPVDAYMNDVFTVPASLAGLPAVSVPVEGEGGEMVGMQVIAQYGDDGLVLDVAEMIERK